jgi:DNA polymerase III subunit epsilon
MIIIDYYFKKLFMKLNLQKDLVFFDLETTGVSTSQDKIIQIGLIKYFADGREPLERKRLINPEIPISEEAIKVHGITNEMVKDEPTFKQVAKALSELIGDADLCGFNSNRFDVPMLIEEFYNAGVEFDMTDRKSIDVWKIFQKMEPRNLKAAYRFYCDKELEGAHDALNDVRATAEVLEAQLDKYKGVDLEESDGTVIEEPVKNDMNILHDFTNFLGQMDYSSRFLKNEDGVVIFNFGKYQNQSVIDVIQSNPSYYDWFMKAEFTVDSKKTLERVMEKHRQEVYDTKVNEGK